VRWPSPADGDRTENAFVVRRQVWRAGVVGAEHRFDLELDLPAGIEQPGHDHGGGDRQLASDIISPCTAPIASKSAASTRYMRVRTTSRRLDPTRSNASAMISKHLRACAAGSGSTSPSDHLGAVPATNTRSPTRKALL
jgi:hypothetical protein